VKKILVALCLAATLVACERTGVPQTHANGSGGDIFTEDDITLNDGRVIHCLFWYRTYEGGMSCDWSNAK
jgi:major membrane immunogen (membrane-anchored lipoprotein)